MKNVEELSRRAVWRISVSLLLLLATVQGVGQRHKANPDDVMDAVMDMKRAVELVDKITPEAMRYCGWGIASLDASDLDTAISRFLLNHGSKIPDDIPASKMWHVSLIASGMVHQFAVGIAECDSKIRYSEKARSVATSASPIFERLLLAQSKFDQLADQQTLWQEESASQDQSESYNRLSPNTGQVEPNKVQSAAKELKNAAEAATRVTIESAQTKDCVQLSTKPPELTYLTKLVDYFEHTPHLPSYIPAGNMWRAKEEALAAQLDIVYTLESCSLHGEKKQALNKATEALQAYHRLRGAIDTFDSLALQQTEWEEQNAEKATIQEQ
jgi:hypothetical protein